MNKEAERIIEQLRLQPHVEGGWFRHSWNSDVVIPQGGLPEGYSGERASCSLIYYMLVGEDTSSWHKLRSPEIWTWHSGGTLEMTLGGKGKAPVAEKIQHLGPRLEQGEDFQMIAPTGQWQTSRIVDGEYVLVSCIVSPQFHGDDFEFPDGGEYSE